MERGHPVRLSAKREQRLNEDPMRLMSVLRTLADRMSAFHRRARGLSSTYLRPFPAQKILFHITHSVV
jgi:hypothetical protein